MKFTNLPNMTVTVISTTLYWRCGHVTDHAGADVPAACPECCGTQFIKARITEVIPAPDGCVDVHPDRLLDVTGYGAECAAQQAYTIADERESGRRRVAAFRAKLAERVAQC